MSDSINKNNEVRKATIHDWNFLWSLLYKMGKTDSEQEVKERCFKNMVNRTEGLMATMEFKSKS